jgi:hypothetical protein
MAVEGDIPANIADHVQRQLSVFSAQLSVLGSQFSEETTDTNDQPADENVQEPNSLLSELKTDN